MQRDGRFVIAVNTGSSSLKLDVFVADENLGNWVAGACVTGIGLAGGGELITTIAGAKQHNQALTTTSHQQAAESILAELRHMCPPESVTAVGHRIVHGGVSFTGPVILNKAEEDALAGLALYDPEHTPMALALVDVFERYFPGACHTASFDTAFFRTIPEVARIIPVPAMYRERGLRRFGFHGLSYTSLQGSFLRLAGTMAVNGRVIYAHLGSGASLAATKGGSPVDMTMGFTPASGVVMSTRSGDIDPGIVGYLAREFGLSIEACMDILHTKSGLLAVSGSTPDMLSLLEAEPHDEHAALAVSLFVHSVRKAIGALSATLGGVDSLVFSGGIGEKSAVLRARICENLEYAGIQLDPGANERSEPLISATYSRAGVHVLPTNEAQVIATESLSLALARNS